MKKLLTLLLLSAAFVMNAQIVQVSGNQTGTWSGEIHIIDEVVVPNDDTLTISAGATVIADGYFGITVLGSFFAMGEENARISFTVADTTGYSDYENPVAGGWEGIHFSKPDNVKLFYCDFSYGKTKLNGDGGAMRIFYGKRFDVDNCTFHHNTMRKRGGAIYAENSTLNISNCEFYDNFGTGYLGSYCWGVGCQFLKCDITMHDVVFHDNYSDVAYGGGMNIDSCNMELYNAVFYNNMSVDAGGLGIQRCKDYSVKVTNMLAYNNSVVHYGGGMAIAISDPELTNITLTDNYCGGGGGAGMQMYVNSAPTISNSIIYGNHAIYGMSLGIEEYYIGSQIWLWGDGNSPLFYNSTVQYGLDSINGSYQIPEEHYINMIKADPLFVDAENHDYQLLANSPCINTGREDLTGLFVLDTDLAGGPRIFNDRIDMGCYEWNNIGVDEVLTHHNALSVYPNPLNDNAFCVVTLDKKSDVVLKLISLDGKEIYRENVGILDVGENRIPLDRMMKSIEKGNIMYLLVIDNQYVKIIY